MGVTSIHDVYKYVSSHKLREILDDCKDEHDKLDKELQQLLSQYHDEGKGINPLAKSMSWMKTNIKLGIDNSDNTIDDLMTDGCNMGIKSLSRYLNQYAAADEVSKYFCKRLIALEEKLAVQMRDFL